MRRKAIICGALLLVTAGAYLMNGRATDSGDTIPAMYLPFSLIGEGDLDLDEFEHLYDESARSRFPILESVPYYLRQRDGSYYSAYTPGPALLALPVYLVPVLAGLDPGSRAARHLAKVTATLFTSLSVVFLFLALAMLVPERWAIVLALVYGLGTASFNVSSQALWQHGPSQLFLSLMLYLLVRGEQQPRAIPLASLAFSLAVVMRSHNLLLALPLGLFVIARHRRQLVWSVIAAAPPLALLLGYYLAVFGTFSPQFEHSVMGASSGFRQIPLWEGLYGTLLSPARGLFVYSPVLLFAVPAAVLAWRQRDRLGLAVLAGALLVILLASKWFMWWGGHCYGPRLLADVGPLLCFALHPLVRPITERRALAVAFVAAAVLSVAVQLLGALRNDGRWDLYAETDRVYATMLTTVGGGPVGFYIHDLMYQAGIASAGPVDRAHPTLRERLVARGDLPPRRPARKLLFKGAGQRLIEEPVSPGEEPLELSIATDAPVYDAGATVTVSASMINPRRPESMSLYALLQQPGYRAAFFDGYRFHSAQRVKRPWPAWVRNSPIPYRFDSSYSFTTKGWPPGSYEMHLVCTDHGSRIVEARATTRFEICRPGLRGRRDG